MPTVAEVLLQSGFSQKEIDNLDQRATTAFSSILSSAEQERQRAELEKRANVEFYETKVMPGLLAFDDERLALEGRAVKAEREANYYRAAAQSAGILPGEEPPRDGQGRFVANVPGSTPGSPTFVEADFYKRLDSGIGGIADIQWKHQSLFNSPLPISPSELIRQADAAGLNPTEFAARKFKFSEREAEMSKKRQEEHDEQIRRAAVSENDRKWAEKMSSNPDLRQGMSARNAEIRKATRSGEYRDPLKMTDADRRAQTKKMIQKDLAENEQQAS